MLQPYSRTLPYQFNELIFNEGTMQVLETSGHDMEHSLGVDAIQWTCTAGGRCRTNDFYLGHGTATFLTTTFKQ